MTDRFETEWARCSPWIESALVYARGTHSIDDVKAAVIANKAWFWPGERSAAVTEIRTYPQFKEFHIWLVGGELDELVHKMLPVGEAYGRAAGCTRATFAGRPGWGRVCRSIGYEPLWNVCMKEFSA